MIPYVLLKIKFYIKYSATGGFFDVFHKNLKIWKKFWINLETLKNYFLEQNN